MPAPRYRPKLVVGATQALSYFNLQIFSWVSRDAGLIICARTLRTFSQTYLSILMASYFELLEFTLVQLGVFLSVSVAGIAFFAFLTGLISASWGRRRLLVGFSLVSAAAAIGLFFTEQFLPLLFFSFVGSLVSGGGGGGESPAQPLEQACLPDTTTSDRRTDLFALYGIVPRVATALGAFAAGLPVLYGDSLGLSKIFSIKLMFLGFAFLQVAGVVLYAMLSPAVEGASGPRRWTNPLKLPSRRLIFTLNGLFSVDHFAGSLAMQTLIAYWFATRFGIELGGLALVFFLSNALAAASLWVAAKIANRIGLINTMVFTHIPSNIFFIAAAFAPVPWVAVLFWQLKSLLGQMDVPARDSYTMAVVGPEERVTMASMHVVSRSVTGAIGPSVAAALWNALSAGAPIMAAGALKLVYDISLFAMFRNVRPPEEMEKLNGSPDVEEGAP